MSESANIRPSSEVPPVEHQATDGLRELLAQRILDAQRKQADDAVREIAGKGRIIDLRV